MGMTWAYGTDRDEGEAIATIHEAIDLGINFLDTAEVYGPFTNEELVGKAIRGRRERVVIATKFGFTFDAAGRITGADSRPEHVREVVEGALRRLGTDSIDLLYQHRVDPGYLSRTWSARWPSWSGPGRCATSGCPRPGPPRCDGR